MPEPPNKVKLTISHENSHWLRITYESTYYATTHLQAIVRSRLDRTKREVQEKGPNCFLILCDHEVFDTSVEENWVIKIPNEKATGNFINRFCLEVKKQESNPDGFEVLVPKEYDETTWMDRLAPAEKETQKTRGSERRESILPKRRKAPKERTVPEELTAAEAPEVRSSRRWGRRAHIFPRRREKKW